MDASLMRPCPDELANTKELEAKKNFVLGE
jgi:hypothetical protein